MLSWATREDTRDLPIPAMDSVFHKWFPYNRGKVYHPDPFCVKMSWQMPSHHAFFQATQCTHHSKSTNIVHHSLHDDGVPTFPVVLISRTLTRRYNQNVCSSDYPCTLWKVQFILKSFYSLLKFISTWHSDIPGQQNLHYSSTYFFGYNKL